MSDTYLGAAAERITYTGLLYRIPGQVCGEIPDFPGVVASGTSEAEVRATLQGLLEEHVEEMVDDGETLPEPDFETAEDVAVTAEMSQLRTVTFTVVLPSTISKSLLITGDFTGTCQTPKLRQLCFNAVVLKTLGCFGGHFPDLPGAFTSGETVEETCSKLQELLEFYVGGLVKNGISVPEPTFQSLSELDMSEEELQESPIVCMTPCSVELHS